MKLLLILFFVFTLGFFSSAQNLISETENNIRLTLHENNEDYLELEKSWLMEGKIFPALVVKSEAESQVQFIFFTYKTIREERKDAIHGRLISVCSSIEFLSFDSNLVEVHFNQNSPESEILEFFKIMGYHGYDIY